MKFKVKISRTEIYERVVEIEADSKDKAIAIAKDNEEENEYAYMFDCPDDVTTDFAIEDDGEEDKPKNKETHLEPNMFFSPFKRLKVIADVDWDGDDGDELPDHNFEVTFTADELKELGFIKETDDDSTVWTFVTNEFGEWFGEYLTSFTDFCHKGFTYKVQPCNL